MSMEERDELRAFRRTLVHVTANLMALRFAIRHNMPEAYRRASANLRKEQTCLALSY